MIRRAGCLAACCLAQFLFLLPALAAEPVVQPNPAGKAPIAFPPRAPWTTSRVEGSPEPPSPYRTEVAFSKLRFEEPLELVAISGMQRFAIAERPGKIFTFPMDPATAEKKLLLDVGQVVYSVAFHPQFAKNGQIFVASEIKGKAGEPGEMRILRYRVPDPQMLVADQASAELLLSWKADGHRGGCLRFGPDGLLYVAVGDGSGIADQLVTGQDISDLYASILRIDINRKQDGLPYAIPADNPFVSMPKARPEIWAYGLRQAWKFSFDPASGDLWAADVGQDLWENLYLIVKGGNYGWSVTEGLHPFRPERPKGPTPIEKPIVEHSHNEARSITGGYIQNVSGNDPLNGAYIYGDYDTGKIWSLRYDRTAKKVLEHRELTDTTLRVVAFGQDHAGQVYIVDFIGGAIHKLVPEPPAKTPAQPFPQKLSETGLFASTKDHRPAAGVVAYSVNAPLWSDGAEKDRFIALPGNSKIEFDTVTYPQPAPGALPGWRFPDGTVLVKTFSLDLKAGDPASRRRLETRILHYKHMPGTEEVGTQFWRGYTYVWNDEQTDAELLETTGANREFTINDPAAPGGKRVVNWRFPSRAECTLCHTMSAKYALGVNTAQMNKDHHYDGVTANQLEALAHMGLFDKPLPKSPAEMPKLVDYRDETKDLNRRARSYLEANCAHCHRKWGGGNAEFQLLAGQPLDQAGVIDTPPGHGRFDLADPRILAPGQPERSLIATRIQRLGLGRMPHIGSNVVDQKAVDLLSEWIRALPKSGYASKTGLE